MECNQIKCDGEESTALLIYDSFRQTKWSFRFPYYVTQEKETS